MISFNSGLRVCATFFEVPGVSQLGYTNIGNIFSLFGGTISQDYLRTIADPIALVKKYPSRVVISGDTVTLSGCVLLTSSPAFLKITLCVVGMLLGGISVLYITTKENKDSKGTKIATFATLGASFTALYFAARYVPSHPGVYFLR